jgi:hypothetical protein
MIELIAVAALAFVGYKAYKKSSTTPANAPSTSATAPLQVVGTPVAGEPGPVGFDIRPVQVYGIPVTPYKLIGQGGASGGGSSSGSSSSPSGGGHISIRPTLKL